MIRSIGAFILISLISVSSGAQIGAFSKDDMMAYTPLYKGERFQDGRPRVSDDLLARMKKVNIEEAWSVLQRHGFINQFEGNWKTTSDSPVLVGRAVTGTFMPIRPDMNDLINEKGKSEGRIGAQNSWIIDTLVKGDVLVVDLFGKVVNGTYAGDNLGNAIKAKSGNGYVVDGGSRDLDGILRIPDFTVFVRGWDPSFLRDVMLMGINSPIRIGQVTVMPGDIVLGGREGILFIPPHLAHEVVETSELIQIRDAFGQEGIRAGKYTPGQIDTRWSPKIEKDFDEWLKIKGITISKELREKLLSGRTW